MLNVEDRAGVRVVFLDHGKVNALAHQIAVTEDIAVFRRRGDHAIAGPLTTRG